MLKSLKITYGFMAEHSHAPGVAFFISPFEEMELDADQVSEALHEFVADQYEDML